MIKDKIYDSVKSLVSTGIDLDHAIQRVVGTDRIDTFKEALSEDQIYGLNLNKVLTKPIVSTITDQKISLRKLSLKSKMDTGRYMGWTVEEILKQSESYLPWCYYNLEKIGFVDEVMEKMPDWVTENLIDKPGTDKELWLLLQEVYFDKRKSYKDLPILKLRNLMIYYKMKGKPLPQRLYEAWKTKKSAIERSDRDDTPSKDSLRSKNQRSK